MQNRPWIGPQFASLFCWGRPPIPWDIADKLSMLLKEHAIANIGVSGSLSPSILTAVAFDAPDRHINTFAFVSMWNEAAGWDYVIEDSPGMEETHPWATYYLPATNKRLHFCEGATPFFASEALFVDLPFSHRAMHLKLNSLRDNYKLVLLGFLEGHDGPMDLLEWVGRNGYSTDEVVASIENAETGQSLHYRLVSATK